MQAVLRDSPVFLDLDLPGFLGGSIVGGTLDSLKCLKAVAKGPSKETSTVCGRTSNVQALFSWNGLFGFNCLYFLFLMFQVSVSMLSQVK